MIWIGIDPGVSGAISAIGPLGGVIADMPTTEIPGVGRTVRKICGRGLADVLRSMVPADEACMVLLEDVHVMPSSKSGSAANTSLLHSKGVIEGVLGVLRLNVTLVNSQRWKRLYGLDSDKSAALAMAKKLYPNLGAKHLTRAKDHNRAESLLIAHYGKVKLA